MTAAKFGARACAAAFVLGVALVPHPVGVASADAPDTDSSPVSSAADDSPRDGVQRPGRVKRQSAANQAAGEGRSASRARLPRPAAVERTAGPGSERAPQKDAPSKISAEVVPDSRTADFTRSRPRPAATTPVVSSPADIAKVAAPAVADAPLWASAVSAGPIASAGPSRSAQCAACWGTQAPTVGQAVNTVINHLFNSAFDWLSTLPGNAIPNLIEGALILLRRSLFLSPEGVTATQVGNSLSVSVNTGSVAYFRQDGTTLQVSGDPGFRRAETFDGASIAQVAVANTQGNAGCAGLVLESGVISSDLTTTQIDSIRFGADAAVAGEVKSAVSGGALRLRDAVRGLSGVEFDGPVVLTNDVEIDGGTKYVTFTGTVDAATAGKQSLTVTALDTTTFAAAVGGQAALSSLLTRGIAPLNIPQSTDTKTVPLHFLPEFAPNGQAQVKYGIDVAIGDNPSQVYEFDTGGTGFWAGYNPSLWTDVPLTAYGLSAVYTSGNYYDGVISNTEITIGRGDQTVSTGQPIGVAAILAGGNPKGDQVFDFTNPLVPPVESHFFGDFGASFATAPVAGLDTPLANPLFQLPGNLSSGFLVQLGPIGIEPQLSVGVTDALRAQFTYAVPVAVLAGGGSYPVSGYQVLQEFGFAPQYFAQAGTGPKKPIGATTVCPGAICLGTLIDSGAPSTGVRLKGMGGAQFEQGGQLQPGVNFIAEFPTAQGRPPLEWTFVAGNNGSVDLVQYQVGSVADSNQNVNTGLNLYNYYDIMFDIAKQVIWLRPTGGQSTVVADSVTTTGDQTYRQNATLGGTYTTGDGHFSISGVTVLASDTTVNAGTGDVTFSGTVDGGRNLTVNSSGATRFVRQVGGESVLQSLTTDAGGSTATASVLTTGNQNYRDPLTINGQYSLDGGSFTAVGDTRVDGPSTIAIAKPGNAITFGGRIDAQEGRGYSLGMTLDSGGAVNLDGDVGSQFPLGGLAVTSATTFTARGSMILDGSLGFAANDGLSLVGRMTADLTEGGQIRNFTGTGIALVGLGPSEIGNFVITNNKADGIQVLAGIDVTLSGNAAVANGGNGIEVIDARGGTIANNSIIGSGANGIQVTTSGELLISTNTINNTTGNGILSSASASVEIAENSIYGNGGTGVIVDAGSVGNAIVSNSIYGNGGNGGLGIQLRGGGNADQPAPTIRSVSLTGNTLTLNTIVRANQGYSGNFTVQVFYTEPSGAPGEAGPAPQGQQLLYTEDGVAAGDQTLTFPISGLAPGGEFTVIATPDSGQKNTSEFSNGKPLPSS